MTRGDEVRRQVEDLRAGRKVHFTYNNHEQTQAERHGHNRTNQKLRRTHLTTNTKPTVPSPDSKGNTLMLTLAKPLLTTNLKPRNSPSNEQKFQ